MDLDDAKKPKGLFNEIVDAVFANLLASFIWAYIAVAPAVIIFCWKRSRGSGLKPKLYLIVVIVFGLTWLALTSTIMGYGAYRNLPSFAFFVNHSGDSISAIFPKAHTFFNLSILQRPKIWHLCLVAAVWVVHWWAMKKWRERLSARQRVVSAVPAEEQDQNVVRAAGNPAPLSPAPVPNPVPAVVILECGAFNLPWRKNGNTWNPVCPLCGSGMGLLDIQREGMYVHNGGRPETGCVAECSNPACKNRVHVARRKDAARRIVQEQYDQKGSSR